VERKRTYRGENPQPPGRCLFAVEISHHDLSAAHGFTGAAGGAGVSGTPSSATSLIFE
jgi:hypothetical protein